MAKQYLVEGPFVIDFLTFLPSFFEVTHFNYLMSRRSAAFWQSEFEGLKTFEHNNLLYWPEPHKCQMQGNCRQEGSELGCMQLIADELTTNHNVPLDIISALRLLRLLRLLRFVQV